jgi:hypothetical protein
MKWVRGLMQLRMGGVPEHFLQMVYAQLDGRFVNVEPASVEKYYLRPPPERILALLNDPGTQERYLRFISSSPSPVRHGQNMRPDAHRRASHGPSPLSTHNSLVIVQKLIAAGNFDYRITLSHTALCNLSYNSTPKARTDPIFSADFTN